MEVRAVCGKGRRMSSGDFATEKPFDRSNEATASEAAMEDAEAEAAVPLACSEAEALGPPAMSATTAALRHSELAKSLVVADRPALLGTAARVHEG